MTALRLAPLALLVAGCTARPPQPASAADTVAPVPARIGFAIITPQAGDSLVEGRAYTIRWMAPDTFRINLGVTMGGKDKGMLLTNAPARPDSLRWVVPAGFVTGFGPASSDQVRLRLENAADPQQWTEAGPFTIVGDTPR